MTIMFSSVRWLALFAAVICLLIPTLPLNAKTIRAATSTNSSPPIEIDADNAIEWRQKQNMVLAQGNARAVRGDLRVNANVLRALYRELVDGTTQFWRLDASGNVEIISPSEVIHADQGSYDLDKDILLLQGDPVTLTTDTSRITAKESMEYRTQSRTLIARGDATAVQGNREMRGDIITVYLSEQGNQDSRLQRIEAETDVRITTPNEVMRGDHATYDLVEGKATLTGDVKVTRGETQLNGCKGELDLSTGVSRLLACDDDRQHGSRVRVLILPNTINQRKNP